MSRKKDLAMLGRFLHEIPLTSNHNFKDGWIS